MPEFAMIRRREKSLESCHSSNTLPPKHRQALQYRTGWEGISGQGNKMRYKDMSMPRISGFEVTQKGFVVELSPC